MWLKTDQTKQQVADNFRHDKKHYCMYSTYKDMGEENSTAYCIIHVISSYES